MVEKCNAPTYTLEKRLREYINEKLEILQLSKQDSCHWRELEACAIRRSQIFQSDPIPQNEAEIDSRCQYLKEAVACATNYTDRCATPLYRQLISFINSESEENLNLFCTPGNEMRTTLLKHSECLSKVWKDQQSCANDAFAAITKLPSTSSSDRVNLACCSYRRFRSCGADLIQKECGAKAKEFVGKFIAFSVSNLPDIVCQNFKPEDAICKALLPEAGTVSSGNNDSPFNRFIEIFTSSS
ncbi:uncharacterized protein LOC111636750 [Centruroides sculpturatus]|uniref:uncharacterized protein LOC111636750 n=1 Tax=Centruroides sculpturatus TaxID=218467 RepID=UPI000C6DF774|nr:uncharacterized protein LOC111636750 [Centruroides sculpturatus]